MGRRKAEARHSGRAWELDWVSTSSQPQPGLDGKRLSTTSALCTGRRRSWPASCSRGKLGDKATHPATPPPSLDTMVEPASPTSLLVLPPGEPPPPYTTSPHRSRRNRRPGARIPSDPIVDCEVPTRTHPHQRTRQAPVEPNVSDEETATETSPLLSTPILRRRQRTLSHTSTVRSNISGLLL